MRVAQGEGGHTQLRARFAAALHAVGGQGKADVLFADLARWYGEPHRHYHTLEHVDACLTWLDWMAGTAERAAEVELALWFHDTVYHPGRPDNEQASAALALNLLGAMGIPTAALDRIAQHIEATDHHRPVDADDALVVDIDLSVLGTDPLVYDEFERRVRQEYALVPIDIYRRGRSRVLAGFLERPRIYQTVVIHELLEARARANLQRAVKGLD